KPQLKKFPRTHPTYPRGCTGTSRGRHRQRTGPRAVGRGPLLCTTWISLFRRGRNWTRKRGRSSKRFDSQRIDAPALEIDPARRWSKKTSQQVEKGGLARAVRSDNAEERP